MQIVRAQRENYLTYFEASEEEIKSLLRWLTICRSQTEKMRLSSANELWSSWLDETFIGFSGTNKILLYSGHRVDQSYKFLPKQEPQKLHSRIKQAVRLLLKRSAQSWNTQEMLKQYRHVLSDLQIPKEEESMMTVFPSQYLYASETIELADKYVNLHGINSMFEIGAGAGIHIALLARRNKGIPLRVVICDLPQTIFAGYLFLRTVLPQYQIRLPDELQDDMNVMEQGTIQYIIPEQVPQLTGAVFDFALNTQSFQEMDIGVVNSYIKEIHRTLKPGGFFVSKNSRISRHIVDNALDRYEVSEFSRKVVELEAPYTNAVSPFDCVFVCFEK